MINIAEFTNNQLSNLIHLRKRPNILVIDEDKSLVSVLSFVINSEGYNIISASNPEEVMQKIKGVKIDLVMTEFMLKSKSSVELFTLIRKQNHDVPIIVITSYEELISERDIKMFGANELFLKPLNLQRIRSAIRTYCD